MLNVQMPVLSTRNALELCYDLSTAEKSSGMALDVSRITGYQPLAMLMSASSLRRYMTDNGISGSDVTLIYDANDTKNLSYGEHMGFYQSLGIELASKTAPSSTDTCIPIQKISIRELREAYIAQGRYLSTGEIVEREAGKLAKVLSQGNAEFQHILTYLIREMIRNIPEHAGTEDVWVCAQYWWTRGEAEVAILDEGIGVYESLRKNHSHREYVSDEREALRWAIRPGVSEAFAPARGQRDDDVWANSGYGLYMIKRICCALGGRLDFASKGAYLRCYSDGSTQAGHTSLPGTAIGIRLHPSRLKDAKRLIQEIGGDAVCEAKTIKNAFKEASIPSKGLMYEP